MVDNDDRYQATDSSTAERSLTDDDDDMIDEDYLTRDEFNLHKIIVAVTMPGKVYSHWKHSALSDIGV